MVATKNRIFQTLGIAMIGFGMIVGFVFPLIAWALLGTREALTPAFIVLCVCAGVLVGAVNAYLSRALSARALNRVTRHLHRLRHDDGLTLSLDLPKLAGIEATDSIGAFTYALHDLTQAFIERSKREYDALQQSEAGFRLITESMSDLVCLHGADGLFAYVSPSSVSLLGYTPEELVRRNPRRLVHPADRYLLDRRSLAGSAWPETLTYRLRHKEGHYLWVETSFRVLGDEAGRPVHLVSSSRDVSERKRIEEELERSALYDALTKLPNRMLFGDRLTQVMEREKRNPAHTFAVLFLDFDKFKTVNDTLGHSVGDALLVAIGARLQNCVRTSDTVARLGGDEFTILLTDLEGPDGAERAAECIRQAFLQPLNVLGHSLSISASIGIVSSSAGYGHAVEIIRDADIAMYHAKEQGRAGYQTFTPALRQRLLDQLALEDGLREAIRDGGFEVVYQPIMAFAASEPAGFEALVRWHHTKLGAVPLSDFIPAAEETGMIVAVDASVLREACRQVRQWQLERGTAQSLFVSVNVSSQSFGQVDFAEKVAAVLLETGLPATTLRLELTERVFMHETETIRTNLEAIRALGVQLYIDDFGTGYSSLSYLQYLPVTTLKIDRSFVDSLTESATSVELVRTIILMAKGLGLKVVAEGIETPEQLARLNALGCDYGQGYLFAQPLKPDEVAAFIGLGRTAAEVELPTSWVPLSA